MPNTLGERLAQARREMGVREHRDVSRQELAKAAGVDSSMISQYESNAKVPREDTLGRLAKFLGVTPAFLRYGITSGHAPIPPDDLEDPTVGAVGLTEAQKARAVAAAAAKHAPPAAKSGNGGRRRKR
jgi:transcriptional regulator with XRE-family HTH domain